MVSFNVKGRMPTSTFHQKSILGVELQDIHDNRLRRKNSLVSATRILFLEMDLYGLRATRSFSNREMLSYLRNNIGMISAVAEKSEDGNDRRNFTFSPSSAKLRPSMKGAAPFGRGNVPRVYTPVSTRGRRSHNNNVKKAVHEVCSIQLKDIRRLEYTFNSAPQPLVFVRRHSVVISFTPIRIIVLADRLILFADEDMIDSGMKELFVGQLKACMENFQQNQNVPQITPYGTHMSFELSVYEAVFGTIIEILKQRLHELEIRVKKISKVLKSYSIVPVEVNEKVRRYMDAVLELVEIIRSQRRVIDELLEDKSTVALMHLSTLKANPALYEIPLKPEILSKSEEMEPLLESYLMDYNSIQSRLNLMKSQLEGAQAMVTLLDNVSYRLEHGFNTMLIGDTVLSVMSAALSVGIFMSGCGGMNLQHGYEDTGGLLFQGFAIVSAFVIAFFCVAFILTMQKLGILPKSSRSYNL